jgi:hypothetical protein
VLIIASFSQNEQSETQSEQVSVAEPADTDFQVDFITLFYADYCIRLVPKVPYDLEVWSTFSGFVMLNVPSSADQTFDHVASVPSPTIILSLPASGVVNDRNRTAIADPVESRIISILGRFHQMTCRRSASRLVHDSCERNC